MFQHLCLLAQRRSVRLGLFCLSVSLRFAILVRICMEQINNHIHNLFFSSYFSSFYVSVEINVQTLVVKETNFQQVKKWKACPGKEQREDSLWKTSHLGPRSSRDFHGWFQVWWDLKQNWWTLLKNKTKLVDSP